MKPYLIQRAAFRNEPNRKGIDAILRFDYMGSSEFEWGALPDSLNRIRRDIDDYTYFQYSFTGHPTKVVTVFSKKDQSEQIPEILEQLANKERPIRLKERCDLIDWVKPEECFSPYNRNDHWWDIENDWMFWKFDPEFEEQFKLKIQP